MNDLDVSRVLAQIRTLHTQTQLRPATPAPAGPAESGQAAGFQRLLTQALDRVNISQTETSRLQQSFERGDPNTDLASVMLASARAQVQFRATVEVRNRLVAAYQDIMNMPL